MDYQKRLEKVRKQQGVIHTDFERGFIKAEVIKYPTNHSSKQKQDVRKREKFLLKAKNMS